MKNLNLFIAGMEKSGTTSLADWLVGHGLAKYRVPGVKEPNVYAQIGNAPIPDSLHHNEVLLDASIGYATNPYALSRMPEHNTKIVLCLRNSFDRTFSAYSFFRIMCRRDAASLELLKSSINQEKSTPRRLEYDSHEAYFESRFDYTKIYFPAKSEKFIRRYFLEQADNISNQSFMDRVNYEIGFFLSRRNFPFFSILVNTSLTFPLKNLLQKYNPEDIHIVTMDTLNAASLRQEFVHDLLGRNRAEGIDLPPIPSLNTSSTNSAREAKPDFSSDQWNDIRSWFQQDLLSFYETAENNGIDLKYVNKTHLNKNIITQ